MTAAEIDVDVQKALSDLYAHSETARDFGAVANGNPCGFSGCLQSRLSWWVQLFGDGALL